MTAPVAQQAVSTSKVWTIDPAHSLIEFSVKHLMISTVKGRFNTFSGAITVDPNDFTTGSVEVTIAVSSISTGVDQRDAHLRTADFFEVEQYPTITFRSTRVEHVDDDEYYLFGDLTMHGVTKQVRLDVTHEGQIKDPMGATQRAGFTATTNLLRKDFGLTYGAVLETGGVALGDKIKVEIHLEAVQQS
jgi:polyisoprenoid-binding protein YceI